MSGLVIPTISTLEGAILEIEEFHQSELLEPLKNGVLTELERNTLQAIVSNNALPEREVSRLAEIFNSYTGLLNEVFGRCLVHDRSGLVSADPVGTVETSLGKKALTHIRKNTKNARAITGGGLINANETIQEGALREFNEETGGMCTLKDLRLVAFCDQPRLAFPRQYCSSFVFTGSYTGEPVENDEASDFAQVGSGELNDHKWFMDNGDLIQAALSKKINQTYQQQGLSYTSKEPISKTHVPSQKFRQEVPEGPVLNFIRELIEKVGSFYKEVTEKFKSRVLPKFNIEEVRESRNRIGHGWEAEKVGKNEDISGGKDASEWNDDQMFWKFLKGIKFASRDIGLWFGESFNLCEGGVLECVSLLSSNGKVLIRQDNERFALQHTPFNQNYNFPVTINHRLGKEGMSLNGHPTLTSIYEEKEYSREDGVRKRAFAFVTEIEGSVPEGYKVFDLSDAELQNSENWVSFHDYNMFIKAKDWLSKSLEMTT